MSETSQRISEFKVVDERETGYSIEAVDQFFTDLANDYEQLRLDGTHTGITTSRAIRQSTFQPQKGGYAVADVDVVLSRVEDRFAAIERRTFIAEHGREAWREHVEQSAELLMGRLRREDGERFRRPAHRLTKGYLVDDVDALCHRLLREFKESDSLSPDIIRNSVFRSATGAQCYEETQVDVFLDRCIELIHDLK